MNKRAYAPIGIFDSGIGGLTVVNAVREALPSENIIYFGDTARVPYGIKSIDTIREYALEITDFLLKRDIKLILVACNSVSAAANNEIRRHCGAIPVLDVVEAGTKAALEQYSERNSIGVIGTLATVGSGTYEKSIRAIQPNKKIYSKACPLLVPLAEEGWNNNEVSELVLKKYLDDFIKLNIDSLILGCTHYPLFKMQIEELLNGRDTIVIDSALSIAGMAKELLTSKNLLNPAHEKGWFDCFVSDKPQRFQALAERFLGEKLNKIEIISLTS